MSDIQEHKDTELHQAIRSGNVDRVGELLSAGADPNIENFDGAVPLTTCANASADLRIVRLLLEAGANPDGIAGWSSPLVSAVIHGHVAMVDALIRAGANINQPDDEEETALMWAIIKENSGLALYLLSIGADPRPVSRRGGDARSFAQEKGNVQIVAAIDKVLAGLEHQ